MRTQKITSAVRTFLSVVAIVAASAHGATPAARGADDSRIAVTDVAGLVDVTMAGQPVAVRRDSTVLLPARIVTGHDGMLGMTQAGTHITVSNDTDVEIPAEAVDGNLVARLVQHQGNVFYDVAPRDLGKLRVETPFLVAVIKGTQFNVAVQSDSTTISLFEGQLQILTPDGSEVVELNAGEIAIRSLLDDVIRVVGMDDVRVAAPQPAAARQANAVDAQTSAPVEAANEVAVVSREAGADASPAGDAKGDGQKPVVAAEHGPVDLGRRADVGVGLTIDLEAGKPGLAVGHMRDPRDARADVAVVATVDLGNVHPDVGIGATVDLGAVSVDVGAALDLGAAGPAVDVGLDLGGADAGGAAADVDVDLGGATPDVGLDTGVDLGGGSLDVGLDVGVDLAASPVDLAAGVDLGADLDLGGLVAADVGASVDLGDGLDLGATLDLGGALDVGGALELEVDLGLGTPAETGNETTTPPRGGLLGGLLGRP